jgi:calcineurin-like phosphoesterase family protein
MTVWFTSDTHFGHGNVIKYCNRPFKTANEMDEAIIKNWNAVVKHDDHVYHMGDFSFLRPTRTLSIVSRLAGTKYLIKGNHDKERTLKECTNFFVWVKDYFELNLNKQKIVLCHFPFLTWNKSHHGAWNLHGHCHGNLPDDARSLRIDVGVDCHNYTPISFESIQQLMSKKHLKL